MSRKIPIKAVPALQSSTSEHLYISKLNRIRTHCMNYLKSHCIKIFMCWVALAAIGIYYVHVRKQSDYRKPDSLNFSQSLEPPKSQMPTRGGTISSGTPSHTRDYFQNVVLIIHQSINKGANISTINKLPFQGFDLKPKTLHVLSKIHRIADSLGHQRETSSDEPSGRNSNSNSITHNNNSITRGVQQCDSAGLRNAETFHCSELLPSIHNIFFLETSCASNRKPKRNPTMSEKKACSIYSAALHNPSRKVILLFTCPFYQGNNVAKDWNLLFKLPNFFFGRVNLTDFYAETPLSDLYHGRLASSSYPEAHQSDLFRLVVLYLYGGAYMDLDVISLRPLEALGVNFIGNEGFQEDSGDPILGNAVLHFEPNHQFLKACLFHAIMKYVPTEWKTIGPTLSTSTVMEFCNVPRDFHHLASTRLTSCDITILPKHIFYAVEWSEWYYFYEPPLWSDVRKKLAGSYGAHYWNQMVKLNPSALIVGSNQPIVRLAQQHCAPVYINAGAVLS